MPLLNTYNSASIRGFTSSGPQQIPFTFKIDTSKSGTTANSITLRIQSGSIFGFNPLVINWGDGVVNTYTTQDYALITHTYPANGIYTIKATGDGAFQMTDNLRIVELVSWGNQLRLTGAQSMFANCSNMVNTATDKATIGIPGLLTCTAANMFKGCNNTGFNPNVTGWDTSAVNNMTSMFENCANFKGVGITTWDTGNVTDMSYMFSGCELFGYYQTDFGNWAWNTSKVINMSFMFAYQYAGWTGQLNWDTSKVTNMYAMFYEGAYASTETTTGICNWDTSKVTTMANMFYACIPFNASIGNWNTSNVTTMQNMFRGLDVAGRWTEGRFNKPIGNWNTSKVTNMTNMFTLTRDFNQPLDNWNVSAVTDMSGMFTRAYAFNQSLTSWDTSKVTNMSNMFYGAIRFNGDITTWNTSNVTTMQNMFSAARVFNQPIGQWDVSRVTNMAGMFNAVFSNFAQFMIFNQNLSLWCVSLIATKPVDFDRDCSSWTEPKPVWGTCPAQPFIFEATVPAAGQVNPYALTFTPYYATYGNMIVDWGDGTSQTLTSSNTITKVYPSNAATYTVTISNSRGVGMNSPRVITKIKRWSSQAWDVFNFQNCINLTQVTSPVPPTFAAGTSLADTFSGCTSLTGGSGFNNWDVTKVQSMIQTFQSCTSFNWDLSSWCVARFDSEPTRFSFNTPAWTLPKPIWGSCALSTALAWYDLSDEYSYPSPYTGSTLIDITRKGNNGTLSNTTYNSASGADAGGSLEFNGTTSQISISSLPTLSNTTATTIQLWFRVYNSGSRQVLFSKQASATTPGFRGYVNSLQNIEVTLRIGSVTSSFFTPNNTVNSNVWYLLTWVIQLGGTSKVYLNTTNHNTATGPSGTMVETNPLLIGKSFAGEPALVGKVGGFWYYPRELSLTEITQNFDSTKTRYGY